METRCVHQRHCSPKMLMCVHPVYSWGIQIRNVLLPFFLRKFKLNPWSWSGAYVLTNMVQACLSLRQLPLLNTKAHLFSDGSGLRVSFTLRRLPSKKPSKHTVELGRTSTTWEFDFNLTFGIKRCSCILVFTVSHLSSWENTLPLRFLVVHRRWISTYTLVSIFNPGYQLRYV